jgi:hypothetical protein
MVMQSREAADASTAQMREAVAPTSAIEPMLSLGDNGFTYQPKKPNGQVDRTSMFFSGHRGTLTVSGYLNLKEPITPDQRILAGNLIASTLGAASSPKALAKESNCRYLDAALVKRLLPTATWPRSFPTRTIASSRGQQRHHRCRFEGHARVRDAERILKNEGCAVDALSSLGKGAGISYRCRTGNPRAEVVVVNGSRWLRILYAPPRSRPPASAKRWWSSRGSLRRSNDQNRYTADARIDLRSPMPPSRST